MKRPSTDLPLALALALGLAACGSDPASFAQLSRGEGGAPPPEAGWDAATEALPDTGDAGDAGVAPCDINVPADQATISDAVKAAKDGDVVCVAAGDHTGDVSLLNPDRSFTLRGEPGAKYSGQMTLTGAPGKGRTLVIEGLELGCAAENLTLNHPDGRIEIRNVVFANTCGVGVDVSNFGQPGAPTLVFEKNDVRAGVILFGGDDPGNGDTGRVVVKNNLFTGVANVSLSSDTDWMTYVVTGNTFDIDPDNALLLMGFSTSLGKGSTISDNILHGGSTAFACGNCDDLAIEHNVVYTAADRDTYKLPATNLAADPLFVGAQDRHLLPYSPAISFGKQADGNDPDLALPDDLEGFARPRAVIDVGAYEYH